MEDIRRMMGKREVKISIIIPVYNTEAYLRDCFDSAVNQTLKDIEIIAINDATLDNSQDIIDEYAEGDERIVSIVHTENKCLGGARNSGIKAARGKYLMFLDSDDYLERRACEVLYEQMESSGVDFIEFNCVMVNEQGKVTGEKLFYVETQELVTDVFQSYMRNKISSLVCNKIFKRSLWERVLFREHMFYEDEVAVFEIVFLCRMILRLPAGLYYYRKRAGSITNQKRLTMKHVESMARVFKEIKMIADVNFVYGLYRNEIVKFLLRFLDYFVFSISRADNSAEERKIFYGMLGTSMVYELGEEGAGILIERIACAVEKHAKAAKKLVERKWIILLLLGYALGTSVAIISLLVMKLFFFF